MQQITAGAASDKISELRSKLAVYQAWMENLRVNYLPCDAGAPEIQLTREDGGLVNEKHFTAVLEELGEKCEELKEELEQWEGLVFEPAKATVTPLHVANAAPTKKAERSKLGGRRLQHAASKHT